MDSETTERVEISTQADNRNDIMIPWRMAKRKKMIALEMVGEEHDDNEAD